MADSEEAAEIESHFINMPIIYPTTDASVQTTDVIFATELSSGPMLT
jgi:hypothetical protein